MSKPLKIILVIIAFSILTIITSYIYLPINRVGITSELIMLGDLNNDNTWDDKDNHKLQESLANPFFSSSLSQLKIDINKNGLIDNEDLTFLKNIYKFTNPYIAEQKTNNKGSYFPKPRELFKYLPKSEYIQRPLFVLEHSIVSESPLSFLKNYNLIKIQHLTKNNFFMKYIMKRFGSHLLILFGRINFQKLKIHIYKKRLSTATFFLIKKNTITYCFI